MYTEIAGEQGIEVEAGYGKSRSVSGKGLHHCRSRRHLSGTLGHAAAVIRRSDLPAIRLGRVYRVPKLVIDDYFDLPSATVPIESLGFGMWKEDAIGSDAIDYINKTCEKLNRAPQKPCSGELMLRVPPEVHAAVAAAAQVSGKSINQWATEALAKAVHA